MNDVSWLASYWSSWPWSPSSASAIGIGKWLTPTFTLSDQNAIVYVDGAEHKSAKSRISFAKDRVYTVGYAGDLILSMTDDGSCWM